MWKSLKIWVRGRCQKWPCILFGVTNQENKQWDVLTCYLIPSVLFCVYAQLTRFWNPILEPWLGRWDIAAYCETSDRKCQSAPELRRAPKRSLIGFFQDALLSSLSFKLTRMWVLRLRQKDISFHILIKFFCHSFQNAFYLLFLFLSNEQVDFCHTTFQRYVWLKWSINNFEK